jgi:hypothetical protein
MKTFTFISVIAIFLAGCESLNGAQESNITQGSVLVAGKSFYVPIGVDGKTRTFLGKEIEAEKSGKEAADIIYKILREKTVKAVRGIKLETEKEALESAKMKGLDYILYSRVVLWIDPPYIACGEHHYDKAEVEVSIYDVSTKKAVSIDRLNNSGCATKVLAVPFGASTPGERFEKGFSDWINKKLNFTK